MPGARRAPGLESPPAVRLWWASTRVGRNELAAMRADVDGLTAARADRMLRPADTRRVLVAHALLRRAVGPILGVPPWRVDVRRRCERCRATDHGRPYLWAGEGVPVPDVSLAHSGDVTVVAVAAAGLRVGVDVEAARPGAGWQHAYLSVMSAAELAVARSTADPDGAYLRAWTGKEAVAKATGLGLSDDPAAVNVLGAPTVTAGWCRLAAPRALVTFPTVPALAGPAASDPAGSDPATSDQGADQVRYHAALAVLDPDVDLDGGAASGSPTVRSMKT